MNSRKDPFAALKIPDFRRFLVARFLMSTAVQMQSVIVSWQIYDITGDPLSLGLIGLTVILPATFLSLYGGHLADNLEKKRIILLCIFSLFLCSSLLAILTLDLGAGILSFTILPIYGILFLTGIVRGFLSPSIFAFFTQMIPKEIYHNSSTWNSSVWQSAAIAGPALGGIAYGYLGITASYTVDAFLLLFAVFVFLTIQKDRKIPPKQKEPIGESLTSGLRFVFKNQIMLGAISLDMFAVLFGGAVALLPIYAKEVLNVGPQGLGILRSAPAIGAVPMAFLLAYFPPMKRTGLIFFSSVATYGFCILAFAISRNFYLSFAMLALSGAFDNVSVVIRSTIMQTFTPEQMRGRVSAVNSTFVGMSNEIGEFESGVTASLMGTVPAATLGGLLTIVTVGIMSFFTPKLKKLDLTKAD